MERERGIDGEREGERHVNLLGAAGVHEAIHSLLMLDRTYPTIWETQRLVDVTDTKVGARWH
jgi:hypothetical protein